MSINMASPSPAPGGGPSSSTGSTDAQLQMRDPGPASVLHGPAMGLAAGSGFSEVWVAEGHDPLVRHMTSNAGTASRTL